MRHVALLPILLLNGCIVHFREAPPVAPLPPGSLPIQPELIWGVMFGILGVGVGAFMLAELPFKRLGWSVILGSLAIVICCLVVAWVAAHIVWIILGATAIGALSFLWCKMRLKNAARVAWDAVPDGVVVASKAEALLNKL